MPWLHSLKFTYNFKKTLVHVQMYWIHFSQCRRGYKCQGLRALHEAHATAAMGAGASASSLLPRQEPEPAVTATSSGGSAVKAWPSGTLDLQLVCHTCCPIVALLCPLCCCWQLDAACSVT